MNRTLLLVGIALAFLAVALGAFGSHALAKHFAQFPNRKPTYETAVQYQMFHALGIILIATLAHRSMLLDVSGWVMLVGVVLFCGSLYLLATLQVSWLGAIAPLGGLSFLVSWGMFALSIICHTE